MTGIRDDGLPLPQPRRVMTSREMAQWGALALDEQYQAPGECGSADSALCGDYARCTYQAPSALHLNCAEHAKNLQGIDYFSSYNRWRGTC